MNSPFKLKVSSEGRDLLDKDKKQEEFSKTLDYPLDPVLTLCTMQLHSEPHVEVGKKSAVYDQNGW